FSTAIDNQSSVEVNVLQGERSLTRDNRTMGRFHLSGLPAAPRGMPQIEVTFDIDANGIVNVVATDKATGKEQKITITGAGGLAKDDVNRLVKEAEANAADDARQREEIEARNKADAESYQAAQAARQAEQAPNQHNPADAAATDGEVVDAEFAEAK
ncbi:MAG: Hsp70 family protein, partial [Vicinamibacterales bacterium]